MAIMQRKISRAQKQGQQKLSRLTSAYLPLKRPESTFKLSKDVLVTYVLLHVKPLVLLTWWLFSTQCPGETNRKLQCVLT